MLKADKEKLTSLGCYLARAKSSNLSIYANLVRSYESCLELRLSITVSINSVSSKLLGL